MSKLFRKDKYIRIKGIGKNEKTSDKTKVVCTACGREPWLLWNSLCRPGWPLPPKCWVLGLKACATTARQMLISHLGSFLLVVIVVVETGSSV